MSDFSALLKQYRERNGRSQSRLAARADIDHSYMSRLESGQRTPTRDMVHHLADALDLNATDRDQLLSAAGFLPMDVGSLIDSEPSVGAVLDLLRDETIPLTYRVHVRSMLTLITRQAQSWQIGEPV